MRTHGSGLLENGHAARDEIHASLQKLDESWKGLNEQWEERQQLLTQSYDLQVGVRSRHGNLPQIRRVPQNSSQLS